MMLLNQIKGDIYKNICRKNMFVIFLPCLIPLLIGIGGRAGILILTNGDGAKGQLSCMEFINICWLLISGIYVMNIVAILLGVFELSAEIEAGQIRNSVLRAHKRSHVILAKIISMFVEIILLLVIFVLVSFVTYYGILNGTRYATGTFVKYEIFNSGSFTLYLLGSGLRMLILILFSFLLGLRLKPFTCFILTFFISVLVRYSGAVKAIPLYKVSPDYILSQINCFVSPTWNSYISIIILMGYIVIFTISTIFLFRKMDIK